MKRGSEVTNVTIVLIHISVYQLSQRVWGTRYERIHFTSFPIKRSKLVLFYFLLLFIGVDYSMNYHLQTKERVILVYVLFHQTRVVKISCSMTLRSVPLIHSLCVFSVGLNFPSLI